MLDHGAATTLRLEPARPTDRSSARPGLSLDLLDVPVCRIRICGRRRSRASGDPFAALRIAHLLARLPRGVPVRLRDIVDQLNSDYLDWSFSRSVVAAVAVQLQSNWVADFRTSTGFELREGDRGEELVIEDCAARRGRGSCARSSDSMRVSRRTCGRSRATRATCA